MFHVWRLAFGVWRGKRTGKKRKGDTAIRRYGDTAKGRKGDTVLTAFEDEDDDECEDDGFARGLA
jgi:hypothetical protein